MKCPKCNFISFDHNAACPRCGKDLTQERELMGLPSYEPKPLSMTFISNEGFQPQGPVAMKIKEQPEDSAKGGVPEELLTSLGDHPSDTPVPMQIEADPGQAKSDEQSRGQTPFHSQPPDYGAPITGTEASVTQPNQASGPIPAQVEPDPLPEESSALFAREDDATEEKGRGALLELEIEPLEFDLEMEESGKNLP
ncbi:MAG: hypothetical protein JRH00_09775 [Deltaproteobacteria bacterium]|nr:hypothetical protein [Deltaproteobacteria bacterium]